MKTSLESLPEKKQHQLRALVELICAEAEVEMVILFGSFARGDAVEDPVGGYFSDFDVLVIVKSPAMVDKFNVWSKIENRARAITKPTSLSLLVHDIKDVNEQLEKGFYFFNDIKKEGIVICLVDGMSITVRWGYCLAGRRGGGRVELCADAASAGLASSDGFDALAVSVDRALPRGAIRAARLVRADVLVRLQ